MMFIELRNSMSCNYVHPPLLKYSFAYVFPFLRQREGEVLITTITKVIKLRNVMIEGKRPLERRRRTWKDILECILDKQDKKL